MVTKARPVTWIAIGEPGIFHLADSYLWRGGPQTAPKPMCGGQNQALVYRPNGDIYCRYCIVHEGLL
jgi:hypothetical protein